MIKSFHEVSLMIKKYLEVGKIVSTHGLRGDLKVEPWCDTPDFICKFKELYIDNGAQKLNVKSAKAHKTMVILHVDGVDTIEKADAMRNTVLYINRDDAQIEEGAFFVQDLIGLKSIDADNGRCYGIVSDVFKTGANDVYEITAGDNKKYLIPAIPDVVIDIDIDDEIMKIRPIKGIFDDED